MVAYHMKANGQPAQCTASKKACPLGADAIHGSSPEEVRAKFEQAMQAEAMPTSVSKAEASKAEDTPTKATAVRSLTLDPYKYQTVHKQTPYFYWNSKQQGCALELDGGECDDGGYCHHQTYRGISYYGDSVSKVVAESLQLKTLPEELTPYFAGKSPKEILIVEHDRNYYGDDVTVRLQKDLQEVVDAYHYSRPNTASSDGSLEWARASGYDTSGKNEVQALQAMTAPRLPKEVQEKVAAADSTSKQSIPLDKIVFGKSKLANAEAAEIPLNNRLENNAGGIVVANGDNTYTLVSDDYSRFKTVHNAGRKQWNFYVLHPAKKEENRYFFEPRKSRLEDSGEDLTHL